MSVIRDRLELDPDDPKQQTTINPKVIIEVLSPSTEAYDRGEKLSHYKRIPSLDDIVLIAHDHPRIEVWHRDARGWTLEIAQDDGSAELRAIGCSLSVSEVYRDALAG